MGQGLSREGGEGIDLGDLNVLQLGSVGHEFNQLYAESSGKQGKLLDRAAFSRHFKLPGILGDRLFEAFDTKKVILKKKKVILNVRELGHTIKAVPV